MGIFLTAFIVLSFVKIPEPHLEKEKSGEKDAHSALSFRHFILGAIAVFVYVGVEVGVPNFINLFLTNPSGLAYKTDIAGSVVGTYWFLMMVGRLLGGIVGSHVSPKAMLTAVSSVAAALVVGGIFSPDTVLVNMPVFLSNISFGVAEVPICVLLFALCGLCTSVMWGSIFSLATEGLGKYTAMGSGLFMVMVVGGGVLPLLQGVVADSAGYMASYWVIVAGCAFMIYYALIGSRNVNKDIPVE